MNRKNNFDFLRFIFASFVIISHSYPLTGTIGSDWMGELTSGQIIFSGIGVKGFFVISGYLILQSLQRSKSLLNFLWRRFLRLYPGLIVVLALTVIFGPFVYEHSTPYIENKDVWTYFFRNLSLYNLQFDISGIFDGVPYPQTINGSLWTLVHEVTSYFVLATLFFIRKNKHALFVATILLFATSVALSLLCPDKLNIHYLININDFIELSRFFFAGAFLAVCNFQNAKHKTVVLILSIIALAISVHFDVYSISSVFIFPIAVISFGAQSFRYINMFGEKIGDLSYGIYIYAFPIQQTLIYFLFINHLQMMILAWIISIIIAYFSWHYIESKVLKYKNIV